MFVRNRWYAAAWSHEVGRSLLARTLCGEPVVMYRCEDGTAAALLDRCWHRAAPLSLGRLDGDQVICGYHGLAYDPAGRCVGMPHQDQVPPKACVKTFPTVEKHRLLWVWIGEQERADAALVPDLHWNDDPGWVGEGGTKYIRADYRLLLDNLLDLTHETFVHSTSIGDEHLPGAPIETERHGETVTVTRWIRDHEPAPFWKNALARPGNCDRWQIVRFEAPSTISIDVGVAPAGTGAPEGDRSQGVNGMVINAITPETPETTWYFWNFVRSFRIDDAQVTDDIQRSIDAIFDEDAVMLAAQQRTIEQTAGMRLASLAIDAGGRLARGILDALLKDQLATTPRETHR